MTRSFSLLLITLGLTILGSLLYLHFHLMERQHLTTFTDASQIAQTTISQKMDRMDTNIRHLQGYTEEMGIERRRPILKVVEKAAEKRKKLFTKMFPRGTNPSGNYLDEKRWIAQISDSQEMANRSLLSLGKDCHDLFTNHQQDIDLTYTEARERLHKITAEIKGFVAKSQDQPGGGPEEFSHAILMLDFLNVQDAILQDIVQLAGSKAMVFDSYYPVMQMAPEQPRAGEIVSASLMAGSYSNRLANSEVMLIVGGDTLMAGPDGTVDYTFKAGRPGLHTLPTKCIVTTPLTGEVRVGKGSYTYRSY